MSSAEVTVYGPIEIIMFTCNGLLLGGIVDVDVDENRAILLNVNDLRQV